MFLKSCIQATLDALCCMGTSLHPRLLLEKERHSEALLKSAAEDVADSSWQPSSGKDILRCSSPELAGPEGEATYLPGHLYLAGQRGTSSTGQASPSLTISQELEVLFKKVKGQLARGGMNVQDLAMVQVFCTDLSLKEHFEVIYREVLRGHCPAFSFVEVSRLQGGARFELQAFAVSSNMHLARWREEVKRHVWA